ncbi:MAG: phosphoribosyltransferase family protein [Janthinobacterium lividum]
MAGVGLRLDTRVSAWTGQWVTDQLGVRLRGAGGVDGLAAPDLLGLALRRNPRRAHLLVSTVLGKHVPTDPRLVRAAGLRLGGLVASHLGFAQAPGIPLEVWRAALAGDGRAAATLLSAAVPPTTPRDAATRHEPLVIGYAETATGLGHSVADALGCAYLHSTRRRVPGARGYAGFEEEHSHATGHQLLPREPAVLAALADAQAPLVLVDDELSTGRTVANTVRELHARTPREHYVVAGIVDMRSPIDGARLDALAAQLGTRIDVVSLVAGRVELPVDVLERGNALVAAVEAVHPQPRDVPDVRELVVGWPAGVPVTGRFGTSSAHARRLAGTDLVTGSLPALEGAREVLVLGSEELLNAPLAFAVQLADRLRIPVRFSSTTRSPVLAVDADGYAVRSSVAFTSHDPALDGPGTRYAHNVSRVQPWDVIVLVVDSASDPVTLTAPDGVLAALAPLTRNLHLVTLPADDVPADDVPAAAVPAADVPADDWSDPT